MGLLNVGGYYDDLYRWLDRAIEDGFIRNTTPGMPLASEDLRWLLDAFCA